MSKIQCDLTELSFESLEKLIDSILPTIHDDSIKIVDIQIVENKVVVKVN